MQGLQEPIFYVYTHYICYIKLINKYDMGWLFGAFIVGIILIILSVVSSKDGEPGILGIIGIILISAVEYLLPVILTVAFIVFLFKSCS